MPNDCCPSVAKERRTFHDDRSEIIVLAQGDPTQAKAIKIATGS
jgi:hypothetical protein